MRRDTDSHHPPPSPPMQEMKYIHVSPLAQYNTVNEIQNFVLPSALFRGSLVSNVGEVSPSSLAVRKSIMETNWVKVIHVKIPSFYSYLKKHY